MDPKTDVPGSSLRAAELLRDLRSLRGRRCPDCGGALCGHEALFSVVLGEKDLPRCLGCLARALGQPKERLRDHLLEHILRRDCYREGWEEEGRHERSTDPLRPSCLWPAGAEGAP